MRVGRNWYMLLLIGPLMSINAVPAPGTVDSSGLARQDDSKALIVNDDDKEEETTIAKREEAWLIREAERHENAALMRELAWVLNAKQRYQERSKGTTSGIAWEGDTDYEEGVPGPSRHGNLRAPFHSR